MACPTSLLNIACQHYIFSQNIVCQNYTDLWRLATENHRGRNLRSCVLYRSRKEGCRAARTCGCGTCVQQRPMEDSDGWQRNNAPGCDLVGGVLCRSQKERCRNARKCGSGMCDWQPPIVDSEGWQRLLRFACLMFQCRVGPLFHQFSIPGMDVIHFPKNSELHPQNY